MADPIASGSTEFTIVNARALSRIKARGVAEISTLWDKRTVVACGAGQWDLIDDNGDYSRFQIDPTTASVAAEPGDKYVVSVYLKNKFPDNDGGATARVGAAFFQPRIMSSSIENFDGPSEFSTGFSEGFEGDTAFYSTLYKSQYLSNVESLGMSDGFSRGFLGYSGLRLAGLNSSDFSVLSFIKSAEDFDPAEKNTLPAGTKVAVFGCTSSGSPSPIFNGIYVGNSVDEEPARMSLADIQPRPGDVIFAAYVFENIQDSLDNSPSHTDAYYEVIQDYPDVNIAPRFLGCGDDPETPSVDEDHAAVSENISRLQMGDFRDLKYEWNRYECVVTVPVGGRFIVPVVEIVPSEGYYPALVGYDASLPENDLDKIIPDPSTYRPYIGRRVTYMTGTMVAKSDLPEASIHSGLQITI